MKYIRRRIKKFLKWLKRLWKRQFYMSPDLWSYTVFFLIGLAIFKGFELLPEIYNFKEIAIEDIDISDLYYQSQNPSIKEGIIIINTGTLKEDTLSGKRRELTELVNTLKTLHPKRIGVDLYFEDKMEDPVANALLSSALQSTSTDTIVLATDGKAKPSSFEAHFLTNRKHLGYIIVPTQEHHTIREYFDHDSLKYNSFANECAGLPLNRNNEASFLLRYSVKGKGFYNLKSDTIAKDDLLFNFPAVEASYVLKYRNTKDSLRSLFKNKIVLLGHLGEKDMYNPYDILDKHKTPTELEFINKRPIMPGIVIHANAIAQKLAKPQLRLYELPGWLELLLIFIFVYIYIKITEGLHHFFDNGFVRLAVHSLFAIVVFLGICWGAVGLMWIDLHFNPLHLFAALLILGELGSYREEYKKK